MNNKKIYIFTVGFYLCFGVPMPSFCMKDKAKKAVRFTCQALHWGIFAAPFITKGTYILAYKNELQKMEDHVPDAPELVQQFAQKQFRAVGFKDSSGVRIKLNLKNTSYPYTNGKHIFLRGELTLEDGKLKLDTELTDYLEDYAMWKPRLTQAQNITQGLKQNEANLSENQKKLLIKNSNRVVIAETFLAEVDYRLSLQAGVLQHEANHIKNRDGEKSAAFSIIAPFIVHVACSKVPFVKKIFVPKPGYSLLESLALIATAFPKKWLTQGSILILKRRQEQAADDGVADDPQILEAMAKDMRKTHTGATRKIERDLSTITINNKKLSPETIRLITPLVLTLLDPRHPLPSHRAQRFEERAAQLHLHNRAYFRSQDE